MHRVLVTGAGGFIGTHLVSALKARGAWVRGVDLKEPEFGVTDADEFHIADLRRYDAAVRATQGVDHVYALAADMGGMGFISANHGSILRNNALIDLHTFEAARLAGVSRYLYTSSACVYPEHLQRDHEVRPLREADAFPAAPAEAYGWEKVFGELLVRYGGDDFGIETRTVRFHNIYGPRGTWQGGREKAPAAICRKVAEAPPGGVVEIWGDGLQTRSFCYIDDCVEGLLRVMASDHAGPLNLGSDRLIAINDLARMVIELSGKPGLRLRNVPGPQGVRGRNSDNGLLREVLGWEPEVSLEQGMAATYAWVAEQVEQSRQRAPAMAEPDAHGMAEPPTPDVAETLDVVEPLERGADVVTTGS